MRLSHAIVCYFLCHYAMTSWANGAIDDDRFITYFVDPRQQQLQLVWKKPSGEPYKHFEVIDNALSEQGKTLRFAMNAGIFQQDLTPLGLYIEKGQLQYRLNRRQDAYGNFYIQPNGVFLLDSAGQADIIATTEFVMQDNIHYATQSGPMLVIDKTINPALSPDSNSYRVRNGVGILEDGRLVFVISRGFIRFYDFARYFLLLGCQQALYLDGSISKMYLPSQDILQDGTFGPMIIEVGPEQH
ncbi:MAG TPA: hypothetical protein DCR13_02415 [Gammaproteobacteria bacterium]|nr:hypothetical protein [Gammaproteobacteria bacterium]HAU07197.1 hypothetical protein [Gammaproteobacteria bacterium]